MGKWYFRMLDDVASNVGKRLYATSGEICAMISQRGNTWIMERANGYRFPVNEKNVVLNITKRTNDDIRTKTDGTAAADGLLPGKKQQFPPHQSLPPDEHKNKTLPPERVPRPDPVFGKAGPAAGGQKRALRTGSAGSKKAAEKPHDQGTLF